VVRISLQFKVYQIYLLSQILAPICIRKTDYIKALKRQPLLGLLIKDLPQTSIKRKKKMKMIPDLVITVAIQVIIHQR
jgi:hypothetical protein